MKQSKRLLSLLLILSFVLSLFPPSPAMAAEDIFYVSSTGSDTGDGSAVSPFATIQAAYDAIGSSGTIRVMGNLALDEKSTFDESKTVTINGGGAALTYTSSVPISNGTDGLISVLNGSVTLENITVQLPVTKGTTGRVLYIGGGGVTLGSGTTLANGYLAYSGGGILVDGGTLTMLDGATIRDCYIANNTSAYGGGVYIQSGTFTMLGGSITGNQIHTTQSYQSFGGGVALGANGTFELLGGSITGNTADTAGGGVYVSGTLVLAGDATVTGNTPGNLYLPTEAVCAAVSAPLTGSIGLTHGEADYGIVVGVSDGYALTDADADAFFYDGGAYDIRLRAGNLVLDYFMVSVSLGGSNVSSSNTATETPRGADYDTVLSPIEGYVLPPNITVTVGGSTLGSDKCEYNPETGAVHIPGQYVTGDIAITAAGNKLHTISVAATNASVDTESPLAVVQQDTTVIFVIAAPRYARPESVAVTGFCDYTYSDGVLTITNVTGNVAITVDGLEIPHTIHFDPGAGAVDIASKIINESAPVLGTLPIPTRVGYTFGGWFTAGGAMATAETKNTMTEDFHLTARWMASTNVPYAVEHYIEYVDSGLNPGYTGGDLLHYMSYGGVTRAYYHYTTKSYEDGVADSNRTIANLLLPQLGALSMEGLTPSGANEYNATIRPDGSSLFPFYYNRNTYQVTFNPNEGSMSVADQTMAVTYGGIYGQLPDAARAGYTLIGWFTSPTGGVQIQPSDSYLTAGNQTLYAHWQPDGDIQYKVIHMTQNLTDNLVSYDKTPDAYSGHAADILTGTAATAVDVYAIDIRGFAESPTNTYTVTILPDGTGVHYLYYDRIATDVSYDSCGGSVVTMGTRIYFGGVFTSLPAAPTRTGYTFAGWYTGTGTEAQLVTPGTAINSINPAISTTLTLYARWTANSYTLAFITHGGTLSNAKSATFDEPVGTLPTASLTGYIFEGWYLEDTLPGKPAGAPVTADTIVTAATLIDSASGGVETVRPLYAWYTPIEVTVSFNPNGGTMENMTIAAVYDAVYGELPTPTRTGYTFLGWYFEDDRQMTGTSRSTLLVDTTVTARWTANVYKVTLDVQGGTPLTPGYIAVTYDGLYGTLPEPTRANHTFDGWFTAEGDKIALDTPVTITAPQTLFAHWTATGGGGGSGSGSGGGGSVTPKPVPAPPAHDCPILVFDDLDTTDWYHEYTDFVISTGLMTGTALATFSPNMILTRAQMAVILTRVASAAPALPQAAVFDDVPSGHWAAAAIEWADVAGLMIGYGNGSFGPEDPLTREQVTLIIYRMEQSPAANEPLARFADFATVSDWAMGAMRWAVKTSLIVGDEQGRLRPKDSISRVETAALLKRWLDVEV